MAAADPGDMAWAASVVTATDTMRTAGIAAFGEELHKFESIAPHGGAAFVLESLQVHVAGVGLLALPLSDQQAESLFAIGQPAPYGHGTETGAWLVVSSFVVTIMVLRRWWW